MNWILSKRFNTKSSTLFRKKKEKKNFQLADKHVELEKENKLSIQTSGKRIANKQESL